jgi:Ca-activated chloride channel homolog
VRFTAPWFLSSVLVLVPLGLAWLAGSRRRRSAAVSWGNPALAAVLASRRRPVNVYAPTLAVLSVCCLVLALAGPERDVVDTERVATAVLAIDVSRSMEAVDVAPTRLDAAQAAALAFLDEVPDFVRVGVVSFAGTATTLVSPTLDRDEARLAVSTLRTANATALGDALRASLAPAELAADGNITDRGPVTVVFLSDGASTMGSDPLEAAETARVLGVVVHTISLGTPTGTVDLFDPTTGASQTIAVPPDPETLAAMASRSGGQFFDVSDAAALRSIYEGLADTLVEVRSWSALWRPLVFLALLFGVTAAAVTVFRRRFP